MRVRWITGLVVVFGCVAALGRDVVSEQRSKSAGPPVPYVEKDVCPFEGCVYREWVASSAVGVRRDRRANSPVVFSLKKGDKVTAITGMVITTRAGRVTFSEPIDLPNLSGPLHIVPGQTLYLLTYRGEGVTLAWFEGRFYDDVDGSTAFFNDGCDHVPSRCVGTLVQRPRSIWWVQMKNARGQTGWTSETEKFDNKDALGGL